eukprot:GHRQ01022728.1.p1 GENE.GHRQ01022728.1~~GHRQ01022728.1.p1  ORF type:complete len:123 (+),score=6.86 GHRQ01022728.1:545-913(+)
MYFSSTSCTCSFSSLSCSSTSVSCSISFSFCCRDLTSSAAFLSARARLESFSCRNLLNLMRDSCSSKSFFFRASSRFLNISSCRRTKVVAAFNQLVCVVACMPDGDQARATSAALSFCPADK